MPGRIFHDLWIWLQRCEFQNSLFHKYLVDFFTTCGVCFRRSCTKTVCSIGDLWIFPQHVEFPARNLKITWTDKDLKGKENIKRRDMGKRLEKRENHLSKGENVGKDKRGVFTEKNFFSFLSISSVVLATVWSFSFHYAELISFCWKIDVRLWIIGSTFYIWCFVNVLHHSALFMVLSFTYEQFHNWEIGDCLRL